MSNTIMLIIGIIRSEIKPPHGTMIGLIGPIAAIGHTIAHLGLQETTSIIAAETRAINDLVELITLIHTDTVDMIAVDDLTPVSSRRCVLQPTTLLVNNIRIVVIGRRSNSRGELIWWRGYGRRDSLPHHLGLRDVIQELELVLHGRDPDIEQLELIAFAEQARVFGHSDFNFLYFERARSSLFVELARVLDLGEVEPRPVLGRQREYHQRQTEQQWDDDERHVKALGHFAFSLSYFYFYISICLFLYLLYILIPVQLHIPNKSF